jgi:ABC-type antimicrobial peptide transport system permease subunit
MQFFIGGGGPGGGMARVVVSSSDSSSDVVQFLSEAVLISVSGGFIGIFFGYSPAKRASEKDPIRSLKYE